MTQVRAPDIATKEEVLETFTQLMRGEKTAEQMKAADALAKYHGLFAGKPAKKKSSPKWDCCKKIWQKVGRKKCSTNKPPQSAGLKREKRK